MLARLTKIGSLLGALAVPFAVGCGSSSSSGADGGGGGGDDAAVDAAPKNTASAVVPLTSLDALSYAAPLAFGSQKLTVIVDTGSSTTGVAGASCTSCDTTHSYTAGASAVDTGLTTSAAYGDMSGWNAEVYEDTGAVGDGPATKFKFGSITDDSGFFNREGGYDGIMGLGPDAALEPHTTSYLNTAITNGLAGEIAFQLCPDSGTMWLGGFDRAATATTPVFVTRDRGLAPYYAAQVQGASIDGKDLGIAAADFGPTIFDTGTSLTYVPPAVSSAIASAVQASAGYKSIFGTQDITDSNNGVQTTKTSAEIDAALPPFGITFPGASAAISIPATKSYLTYEGTQQGANFYIFAFQDSTSLGQGIGVSGNVSLVGDSLLAGMITIFDISGSRMGFAGQTGCDEPDVARRARPHIAGGLQNNPHFRGPKLPPIR